MTTNSIKSKRNIYYQDPELFKSQATVDRYVDILAYTFGVTRRELNVTAAAGGKGLVCGEVIVRFADKNDDNSNGDVVSMSEKWDGVRAIVGDVHGMSSVFALNAEWILVVEKESTFRTLTTSSTSTSITTAKKKEEKNGNGNGNGSDSSSYMCDKTKTKTKRITITAKGYPDLSTRYFLQKLTSSTPHIPVFTLTDFDPDGFAIESVYAFGSLTLAHEQQQEQQQKQGGLAPFLRVKRLGVRWEDVVRLLVLKNGDGNEGGDEANGAGDGGGGNYRCHGNHDTRNELWKGGKGKEKETNGLLKLSTRDRKKGISVLRRTTTITTEGSEGGRETRIEMQRMLMLGYKAEMEIFGDGISNWVERRLREEMRSV